MPRRHKPEYWQKIQTGSRNVSWNRWRVGGALLNPSVGQLPMPTNLATTLSLCAQLLQKVGESFWAQKVKAVVPVQPLP